MNIRNCSSKYINNSTCIRSFLQRKFSKLLQFVLSFVKSGSQRFIDGEGASTLVSSKLCSTIPLVPEKNYPIEHFSLSRSPKNKFLR